MPTLVAMQTQPERPSDQGRDTLPEFPAVVDAAGSDFTKVAPQVRRPAVRRTGEALAEFAKAAPEMVVQFVEGLLP
jgi:hypothetical protein